MSTAPRTARRSVLATSAAAGAFGFIMLAAPGYGQTPAPNANTEPPDIACGLLL